MTNGKQLANLNFWDLPCDIKLKIYNINKEAERLEQKTNIYNHLNGKIKIIKNPKLKTYYWLNCVSCGKDVSKFKNKTYHWCYNCYLQFRPPPGSSPTEYARRTRPILLGRDRCPLIINNSLVLVPKCREEMKYCYCMMDSDDE